MLTAAPAGFPAELYPLNPLDSGSVASGQTLRIRRQVDGDQLIVEAEVKSGPEVALLIRERWVEGEPWWREYERYVHGEKDLEAKHLMSPAAEPVASSPHDPPWLAMLRNDPRLQVPITLDSTDHSLQSLCNLLSQTASLRIDVSPELAAAKPLFGSMSIRNAPVWQVMQQGALHNIVAGRLGKNGYWLSPVWRTGLWPWRRLRPPRLAASPALCAGGWLAAHWSR